jgi:hypothetical protein
MNTQTAIVLIVALIVVALLISTYLKRRRSVELKDRFGPEYDHEVKERGLGRAERELDRRARRVEKLAIRPLPTTPAIVTPRCGAQRGAVRRRPAPAVHGRTGWSRK